ncbi:hypothetical protein Pelo_14275 [Pelomyxa schiedti]|nr:hypothetical protein Pelo_14275 [Pelomyxa schiedti]
MWDDADRVAREYGKMLDSLRGGMAALAAARRLGVDASLASVDLSADAPPPCACVALKCGCDTVSSHETCSPHLGGCISFELHNVTPQSDPIRWFSLLPPKPLRDSQKCFREALRSAVAIADLQHSIRVNHVRLQSLS